MSDNWIENASCSLQLDEFKDNKPNKICWPLHGVVLGPTMAGKTSLMCNILDSVDNVYTFSQPLNGRKTLVVISPNKTSIELSEKMDTKAEWDIIQYGSDDFGESLVNILRLKFIAQESSINVLVVDDTAVRALQNRHMRTCLNNLYTSFRHLNVSVWTMLHTYDRLFRPMMDNAGVVIVMFSPSIMHDLRCILSQTFFRGTADIVRDLKSVLVEDMELHDYIVLNKSKEAFSGLQFYITNTIFNPKQGMTVRQFLK